MKKRTLLWLLVLFLILVYIPSQVSASFPTGHPDNAFSGTFSWFNDHFNIYIWSENNSIWIETEPIGGDVPFICSSAFKIIQNAVQYDTVKLLAASGSSQCGDVYIPSVFQLTQWSFYPNPANLNSAFTLLFDGGSTTYSIAFFHRGALTVSIAPQGAIVAGGQWRRTGTATWFNSGVTETSIPVGSYNVEFKPIPGWTTPGSVGVTIARDQTKTTTGTYVFQTGKVVINPQPDAMNATAPWTLTYPDSHSQSGTGDLTLNNCPVGYYMIAWGNVPGWITPSPAEVTKNLTTGGTITFSGTYVEKAPVIQVTPSALNFDYVPPGSHIDLTLMVKNVGGGILTGTVSSCPPFSIISGGNYRLGAGQSQQVTVRYTAPLERGVNACSLVFTGGGGITVEVKGTNIKASLPWLMLLLD